LGIVPCLQSPRSLIDRDRAKGRPWFALSGMISIACFERLATPATEQATFCNPSEPSSIPILM
jgi:hypothetical protein